jgi:Co/Zn/Cd efflux system component
VIFSVGLVKESCYILLQTIPAALDVEEVKTELFAKFPAILNIHEMHIW